MKLSMKAALALFAANAAAVSADGTSVSLQELQSFWVDAQDVIDDLDSYAKLWIKPHSCVWSECAVDDTDDGYMDLAAEAKLGVL